MAQMIPVDFNPFHQTGQPDQSMSHWQGMQGMPGGTLPTPPTPAGTPTGVLPPVQAQGGQGAPTGVMPMNPGAGPQPGTVMTANPGGPAMAQPGTGPINATPFGAGAAAGGAGDNGNWLNTPLGQQFGAMQSQFQKPAQYANFVPQNWQNMPAYGLGARPPTAAAVGNRLATLLANR